MTDHHDPVSDQQVINDHPLEAVPDQQVLNLNGKEYAISSLSDDVKELLSLYQSWEAELKQQQLAAFKTEAAMKAISIEITQRLAASAPVAPPEV